MSFPKNDVQLVDPFIEWVANTSRVKEDRKRWKLIKDIEESAQYYQAQTQKHVFAWQKATDPVKKAKLHTLMCDSAELYKAAKKQALNLQNEAKKKSVWKKV